MKDPYRLRGFGPGGLKCPCCRPWASKKEARQKSARYARRRVRQDLRKELAR